MRGFLGRFLLLAFRQPEKANAFPAGTETDRVAEASVPGNHGLGCIQSAAWPSRQETHASRRNSHARPDAGLAASVPSHHRPRRDPARRPPGRHPLGRRADPHDKLCRDQTPRVKGGAAARARRHQARRPGGHHGLEHLAASGGLVRHPRHRRGLPYGQSAAVSRPDLLDRQPRRRPADVRRPDVSAVAGEARAWAQIHRAVRGADGCGAYAEHVAEERNRLRRMDRRGGRRFRLEELRRKHRRRNVLHIRDHRPSQGRTLFAPLQCDALHDGGHARRHGLLRARHRDAGGADVPRQLLGPGADLPHGGRKHGDARCQARRSLGLRIARPLQGHIHCGGADGVADAAPGPGKDRQHAAALEARRDRRFCLPACNDAKFPGKIRRRGNPRLGHDRDEPARLALHHQARLCGACGRRQARRPDEAGPSAIRRRDEDHRRHRQAAALGTARPSAG